MPAPIGKGVPWGVVNSYTPLSFTKYGCPTSDDEA